MAAHYGFVTFEGIDGSGKSSLLELVQRRLERAGVLCMPTKMNSWLDADATRIIVEARERRRLHPRPAIERAYLRDLLTHAQDFIVPGRERGVVLQDRSLISAAVYQEVLFGSSATELLAEYRLAGLPLPDLIVFVVLAPADAARRLERRGNQPRYWENEPKLRALSGAFRRVLVTAPPPWLPAVATFDNDRHDASKSCVEVMARRVLTACTRDAQPCSSSATTASTSARTPGW